MSHVEVRLLAKEDAPDVVRVLCDAFGDYPVMRRIIGPEGSGPFEDQLHSLVNFFVMARALRDEPMLGLMSGGEVVATATLTPPGERPAPPELSDLRDSVWQQLGPQALARYEAFGEIWNQFEIHEPHYHLNMIGVMGTHRGQGMGRILLDEVHAISKADPRSTGVTLTTEDPANVPLYEHVGYRVIGHANVFDGLETWGFFRPD